MLRKSVGLPHGLEAFRLEGHGSARILLLGQYVLEIDAVASGTAHWIDIFVARAEILAVPVVGALNHHSQVSFFGARVEILGRNVHVHREEFGGAGFGNREHGRHVGTAVFTANFTVDLRADPRGHELLRLHKYHLDGSLKLTFADKYIVFVHLLVVRKTVEVEDDIASQDIAVNRISLPMVHVQTFVVGNADLGSLRILYAGRIPFGQSIGCSSKTIVVRFGIGLVYHERSLVDSKNPVAVLDFVHVLGYGNPHIVGGWACKGGFEGRLSVCELTHDIDDVVVIAAHHYLVSVLRYQQYTVIQFRTRARALYYHAHRVVGTVLGLEHILVLSVGDIHHVAELGSVDGQGHEIFIFISRPHESASVGRETVVGVIWSHRTEGVGVAHGETRHIESDAWSYGHGEHRMVAYQSDRSAVLELGGHFALRSGHEARPVYHPS